MIGAWGGKAISSKVESGVRLTVTGLMGGRYKWILIIAEEEEG